MIIFNGLWIFEKIDLFKDNKFYKFNYRVGKPVKFAKIIAIDTNICFKIRQKKIYSK